MAYPPLAYFLNSILNGLNFLRECPMLSAKDALLRELIGVLLDSCSFFVGLSSDISVRGAKYLPQGAGRGTADKSGVPTMDKQYAVMLAQELVPHVLICFEHIFVCKAPSVKGEKESTELGGKGRGKSVAIKVVSLTAARSSMGPASFSALSSCWGLLRGADLLPAEKIPVQPYRPPVQPVAIRVDTESVPSSVSDTSSVTPDMTPPVVYEEIYKNAADDVAGTATFENDLLTKTRKD
jgi:hypothetical protein